MANLVPFNHIQPIASYKVSFDNDVDVFAPEFWANESLEVLQQYLVLANLVHRDYEPIIQKFGDTINITKPGVFTAKRKTDDEQVRIQDVSATSASLKLDQHWHTSFIIKDGEESKSYVDLINLYITPGIRSIAESIDKIVAGQYVRFLNNVVGRLGGLTSSTAKDYLLDARASMNLHRVPLEGRRMLLAGTAETEVLKLDNFLNAMYIGDDGTSLREASLGRKLGFDFFTTGYVADITPGQSVGTTTTTAAAAMGASTVAVTAIPAGVGVGTWFTIVGDDTPLQVASIATLNVGLYLPLRRAVASGAAVTFYLAGAVNQPSTLTSRGIVVANGYPAGWHREIAVDGFTVLPQLSQCVTFGTNNASTYTVIAVDPIFGITLDRPLEFAIADNDKVNIAPAGNYNLAFHRNAIALVTRPLAAPRPGTGALSAVVEYNGLAIRATITYQGREQGHLVTCDILCGVAVLESYLATLLLG
jgi:hypothetical protein